jgi:hypothetical protein
MSDQDWPPATIISQHCPLMPAERHCWHVQSLWLTDGLFPPPLVCCWCGGETHESSEVPHRHGPHVPND